MPELPDKQLRLQLYRELDKKFKDLTEFAKANKLMLRNKIQLLNKLRLSPLGSSNEAIQNAKTRSEVLRVSFFDKDSDATKSND